MRNRPIFSGLVVLAAVLSVTFAQAQSTPNQSTERRPGIGAHEATGDSDNPNLRLETRTSPGARIEYNGHVSVQVNVNALGQNIVGDAANEPSIAVDPTDHRRMTIVWRQFDTIASNFRQAGWGYTADGGRSWTFPGVIEPGVFRSDPVVDADSQGNFYFNSLTSSDGSYWCNIFRSYDGGRTWDEGAYAWGGDKQWQVIDASGGVGDGNVYAVWTLSVSSCNGQFTRSTDGGASFEACSNVNGRPYWGTMAVGPDGELYVCGAGFLLAKSSNAQYAEQPIVWDFSTTVNFGGSQASYAGPNPGGLLGQCWVDVDRSDGPNRGNVYMLTTVAPGGEDPANVKFARSTNGGLDWSTSVRINDDGPTYTWQWFGTMSVAPNGRIDAVWFDSRDDPGGYDSALYYSFSEDGGLTWSPNEALTPAFDPRVGWPQQDKLGDYLDMTSDEMGADVAYAATFNGEQDVYYIRIGKACLDRGELNLSRSYYSCDQFAEIEVSDCDLNANPMIVESVQIEIASTAEPAGETVILTETDVDTGVFSGSAMLSETDSDGVLRVVDDDTITATYLDADDGQGGTNIVVTATAITDCTPPEILDLQVTSLTASSVEIRFTTTEPTLGMIEYGTHRGALDQSVASNAFVTQHVYTLSDLIDGTYYLFTAQAEDRAGSLAIDDNQGVGYVFRTNDIQTYFTKRYLSPGYSRYLDNRRLLFSPYENADRYVACLEPIAALPTDPAGGTPINLPGDGFAAIDMADGRSVPFYGQEYSTFYVSSEGYITFGGGDSSSYVTLERHFLKPRIAALFTNLDPPSGGGVSWKQLDDRVAVTYWEVPVYSYGGMNTFQIEMFFDGDIAISYLTTTTSYCLIGLSEGLGVPPDFQPTNLPGLGTCGPLPPTAESSVAATVMNTSTEIVLHGTEHGYPDPTTLDYVITSLPDHGTLRDPAGGPIEAVPHPLLNGGNAVEYVPEQWRHGADSFVFQANDGGWWPDGGHSEDAVISIEIELPESTLALRFPFDTNPGWTMEGAWGFGQPTGGGSPDPDPTSGFTSPYVYGYNLNGNYANNMPPYYLTTTAIDCSLFMNTSLHFQRWLGVQRGSLDTAAIEISNDGDEWQTLWRNAETSISDAAWTQVQYDIAPYADGRPTVYVRWQMGPTDSLITRCGWNIDDVEFWAVAFPPECPGDLNGDNIVNLTDLAELLGHYGRTEVQYSNGDMDRDGDIDVVDLVELLENYGQTCP